MPYTYDPTAYREVFERTFTFTRGFRRNVSRYAHRLALHDTTDDRRWSYAELGADVARLAAGLAERGVGSGDLIAFQLLNSAQWAQLYLAAGHLGAIACPVNFRFSPGETSHVLHECAPAAYIFEESLRDVADEAMRISGCRPGLVASVTADHRARAGAVESFDALLAQHPIAPYDGATAWDESVRLHTSGTTGMPKGVPLPNAAEVLTAHDVIMHFPLEPQDKTLNMTPWFHRGGISPGGPNATFYAGAASVAMRSFDPDRCLDLVSERGLTFLIGAPTNLAMLADAQEARPRDLSTLRGVVTMGAPLERAAALRYQQTLTPRVFNGYGTTEAFWNTFLRPADLPEHAGSAGRSCTDDDVRVVHSYPDRPAAADDLVPQDGATTGEIIMRSLKSGYAYAGNPAEQEAKFRDGWLYSGDLGTWDADEYVTVVGRKDDMIISGGENVHPVQVEEVLNEHPGVVDSIVVGLPDPRWGEIVVAYVQARPGGVTAGELDAHCRAHPMLADFKRPRRFSFVDALPRTATGKKMHYVMRAALREPGGASGLVQP
ncbi:class I adenylate-forming enzyme family protein [Flexivirga caeni]|uniref:class I adenylate-forming enzyme family protein n=1 Tax=Flexivirga caeni TaxID=2294115 RepID=UPI001FE30914|nr:AMP-binding protein [Flexivirga caeni]